MTEYRQSRWGDKDKLEPLIFEKSSKGEIESSLYPEPIDEPDIPDYLLRDDFELPRFSESEVVRHYTRLTQMNYGIDSGIYPLGSCTMKYNPKISEDLASLREASFLHPSQPEETVQGTLEIMYQLEKFLAEISGMDRVSLQPAAGAQGEFTSMLIARKYFESIDEDRIEVIVPDSAHGTNPASASMAGFSVTIVPSNERGRVNLDAFKESISKDTAAVMLTNPNTLGLFEDQISELVEVSHDFGSLLFYDGANMNGILGKTRPGDMGFDMTHFNIHKTFGTPHGGGGPGSGPVGVKKELEKFLPSPLVEYDDVEESYYLDNDRPYSIGKVQDFHGNFGVLLKAYAYILLLGASGLVETTEIAVLNANYIREELLKIPGYELKYSPNSPCKHETVFSTEKLKRKFGVTAKDIAKRLLDYGVYAPTYYFPPIVPEALMIEPTETESKIEIDRFINALKSISEESNSDPEKLLSAPTRTSISRIDEVKASRNPVLSWKMYSAKRD